MTLGDRGEYDLERFVIAQDDQGIFEDAVAELRRGRKTSHWMWFVFPQLAGLGRSATSRHFSVSSLHEARAYLAHPVLGPRLRRCAGLVASSEQPTAESIFGPVDSLKLRSSMTLFSRAAPEQGVFQVVLDRYFAGRPDPETDRLLADRPAP